MNLRSTAIRAGRYVVIGVLLTYLVTALLAVLPKRGIVGPIGYKSAYRQTTSRDLGPLSLLSVRYRYGSTFDVYQVQFYSGPAFRDALQIDIESNRCRRFESLIGDDDPWVSYRAEDDAAVPSWSSLRPEWPRSAGEAAGGLHETVLGWPFAALYGRCIAEYAAVDSVKSSWGGVPINVRWNPDLGLIVIPFVPIALPFLGNVLFYAVGAFAVRFVFLALRRFLTSRRLRRGMCIKCGYDLTGNESGRCPECGELVHRSPAGREGVEPPPRG